MHAHLSAAEPFHSKPAASPVPADLKQAGIVATVMVVDDEVIIADTIVQILNRNGFQAHAVYNGRDAIESARITRPNTVLSDVLMPHIDGVETAIAIRAVLPDTRIVLFSGQAATVEILERARAQGYNFELLPKPIHPVELLKHLRAS